MSLSLTTARSGVRQGKARQGKGKCNNGKEINLLHHSEGEGMGMRVALFEMIFFFFIHLDDFPSMLPDSSNCNYDFKKCDQAVTTAVCSAVCAY